MLIKEYHILLPMSLEEYQVAQLYMIQKKSREESSGEGSGVEILANRPYSDGPGGSGQYTHKIYHVGSHIPSWFRALLPKAALQVEEESWNAYPYTRTRYTCPFVEKFSIEIETYYRPDAGQQTNVFNLSAAEKRQRILDTIDIVRDPISPGEYKPEEDPKLYRSAKTGRGPLGDDWLEAATSGPLMCAYKLCKVEFRYWGMQSKIEQFIHDVGLRKVMLRAHRQAWCWQDEWTDLTMEDIRQLEEETARMLAQKMAKCGEAEEPSTAGPSPEGRPEPGGASGQEGAEAQGTADISPDDSFAKQWSTSSRSSYSSQHGGGVSPQSLSEWRMQNIARDSENSSEEEFFDAHEDLSDSDEVFAKEMTKWSSNDFLDTLERPTELDENLGEGPSTSRTDGKEQPASSFSEGGSAESTVQACRIHVLFLILHSGNILDQGGGELGSKQADVQTLAATFDAVTRVHFPEALGHVALRLVPCPPICAAAYALVSKLSPYSHDRDSLSSSQDHIPLAALPLLATSSGSYQHAVGTVITRANQAYAAFLHSAEGTGFCGQVVLLGDCVGGILGFDALCQSRAGAGGSRSSSRRGSLSTEPISPELCGTRDPLADGADTAVGLGQASPEPGDSQHPGSSCSPQPGEAPLEAEAPRSGAAAQDGAESTSTRLDFKVSGFFLFGSPLGLVLALRKTVMPALDVAQLRPACEQIYNLFHAADPCASRLEPLLAKAFHAVPPLSVPRYQKYPLGDGTSSLLAEALQMHSALFLPEVDLAAPPTPTGSFGGGFWRGSEPGDPPTPASTSEVVKILERWWGLKRIDYSLYCPDALTAFPTITLPHLFHASYWESSDVVAFILRQVMEKEGPQPAESEESSIYSPAFPREKWQRKRTQVKIRVWAPQGCVGLELSPERDGQPPGQRRHRVRGQSAGAQRALHVWSPGCGDVDRREGGHLHHDAAAVGEVAVLWHGGDEWQWAPNLHRPSGQGPGHRHLPRAHGGQGGPQLRGGVPDSGGPGHGVGGVQHRWFLHCQRLHHGQRPQSAGGGCRCRTALAGLGLHDHLRDGAPRHAEAPRGGLALPAQLPPRRRLLLRRAHPRPTPPESSLPAEPALRGGDRHRRRLRLHQGRLCLQLSGAGTGADLHCGPRCQEVPQPVPVPL
ncbi:membrane-associated phosphatidylinositol transfer protein 1 isoform X3 [Numida meleagris]|uniref:membrane-associated phosphatidylinositol transfer protein 1 isoform X3 n=1 Tax=Numida meleagris TaxID=8996 RepID=UPI000B3D976F|nr:membrane-associated phosphatidylinositol transfer protein 1 isoform X3 [Numida meleagris]